MSTDRCVQCKTLLQNNGPFRSCHVCGAHVFRRSDEGWTKMDSSLRFLVWVAVVELLTGTVSVGCGLAMSVLSRHNLVWPLTSFAPIWTGTVIMITGIVGMMTYTQKRSPHNLKLRKLVIAHVTLCQFSVLLGGFNVAYGAWVLSACDAGRICNSSGGASNHNVMIALSVAVIAVGCAMTLVSGLTTMATCLCRRRFGIGSTSGSCY
ncbi:uncharacterized protein LOC106152491 [Lingula anatina]|uniref:Uncharacterized protein LOC106152491 n=1 Tax=Lingula anatina TaxID=7574 RepID=A0A1S3H8V0_LINAN|nr:uncharacterized protein LOC106152491 [Lingula anatina]|eukprot:XP_013381554.1 uncharacterized protein LOC106152491 [Lingula anatina]